jgi:hypothetical protein
MPLHVSVDNNHHQKANQHSDDGCYQPKHVKAHISKAIPVTGREGT